MLSVSIIIPAHNEAAVIGRCLRALQEGALPGELEVIVACNGCTDATAAVARAAAPSALVIELAEASKVKALNAGDEHAHHFPRFYVDADVEVTTGSIRAVAAVLREGRVHCAAPKAEFAGSRSPWVVRAFYDMWQKTPYHHDNMIGSGVYALSEEGRGRFGAFPELTADDQFAQQLFATSERLSVSGATFTVSMPRTIRGLVNIRRRVYRGNRELASSGLARSAPPASGLRPVLAAARRPANLPSAAAYVAVNVTAKALVLRGKEQGWERDESTRRPDAPAGGGQGGGRSPEREAVCYVTSHYPALSHTFVMREVIGVRAGGIDVSTVSVHQASAEHLLAGMDRREAEATWHIFPLNTGAFLRCHLSALVRHPRAYLKTARYALAVSPPGVKARVWQLAYFGEAVYLWGHAARLGVRNFHAHLANVAADICWLAATFANAAVPSERSAWTFTMHGSGEFYAVERFNLRRKVENARAIACISEYTRSQLMYVSDPSHWQKLKVVHCGADLDIYRRAEFAERDLVSLLSVCRLVPEKGLDLLVGAVAELVGSGAKLRLVLVGSGPLEGALRQRVSELGLASVVELAGAVGQDEMARYYADCDIFCLPSFAEGVPVVMMEAMATARPVVASRITGVPELVEEGVSGLLFTAGNQGELTEALRVLVGSPELRQRLGEAGRLKVEASFNTRLTAEHMGQFFREAWSSQVPVTGLRRAEGARKDAQPG